jgi:hypothetical protein
MPETTVQPSLSSHGARGIRVEPALPGSPMNTHTKPSCSTTGYERSRAVRGTRV